MTANFNKLLLYKQGLPDVKSSDGRFGFASILSKCFILVCFAVLTSSCVDDYPSSTGQNPEYISLSFILPHEGDDETTIDKDLDPDTRHGNDVTGDLAERKITTLACFVFKNDNSFETSKLIQINNDNTSSDPMWDPVKSMLRLVVTPGTKNFYVLANWSATHSDEMPDISGITTVAGLNNLVRVHNNVTPSNPPLMTGKKTLSILGGGTEHSVSLTRQIARVEIYPMLSANAKALDANVSIEGVKFTGLAQQAYAFPTSPMSSPSTGTWNQTGFTGTSSGRITATKPADAARYHGPFYIPEYKGTAARHTAMIIHAKYNGDDTYYSVAINNAAGAEPAQYAVERNHSYRYHLTIQGRGSDTEAALLSPSMAEPGVCNITHELQIEKR